MEMGPDGKLYLLEYGTGWFAKNPDAGIARIDYIAGNRPPKVSTLKVDRATGGVPFTIVATVEANDPENTAITYTWNFGNGEKKETNTPQVTYTYTTAGDYKIFVEVKDKDGAVSKSETYDVYAGNETPDVLIQVNNPNKTFILPGVPISYSITVKDKNDTSAFDASNLFVSADYITGFDKARYRLVTSRARSP